MAITNFTKEQKQLFNLTLDVARDEEVVVDGKKPGKKELANYLRDKINSEILKGRTLYQAIRAQGFLIYEIVEEIINVAIGEDIFDSPFVQRFVEFKNRHLGDKTEFYSEGGLLTVSNFAGNHWNTNRQTIDVGSAITLPSEWIYIRVYEDLERFLTGVSTLDKLMDKVYKSINKYMQDRIFAQFNNVSAAVPSEFSFTGNDESAIGRACDIVQAAGGYSSLSIAGTRAALTKLAEVVPDKMFADSQREARAKTGSIGVWGSHDLFLVPQTLKPGTFDLALSDSDLFIMGGDSKPIKVEFYGETRTNDIPSSENYDQSIDKQIQTKFGMGLLLPPYFGKFTWQ